MPGRAGPVNSNFAKVVEALRKRSFAKLGTSIDPEEVCHLVKNDQDYKITLKVPGKKVFSLSPDVRLKKNTPLHNAPRTLTEVTGDFAVSVRVTGDRNPGAEPIKGPNNLAIDFTLQGAGLLLYEDMQNFVRVERCSRTLGGAATLIDHLLMDLVREGKHAIKPIYAVVPEGDLTIFMVRRKGRVQSFVSPKNRMLLLTDEFAFDWPETVKIGLTVSNVSR